MKRLLLIALISVLTLPAWGQTADSVTVDPNKKIIDGFTASEIVGNSIHAESEIKFYLNSPESRSRILQKGFNTGPIDGLIKYRGEIYLIYLNRDGSRWIKANDLKLSLVTDPPEVDF